MIIPDKYLIYIETSNQPRLYKKSELPGFFDIILKGFDEVNKLMGGDASGRVAR